MTVIADTYKIFSINQSTNFFDGSSGSSEPGGNDFIGNGDEQAGFYGEVPVSELFSGTELADKFGLTAGNAQNDTSPWLKFSYEDKILYIAKKPYRYNISWDDLDNVNTIYGGKVVSKNGYDFKARVLKYASSDPVSWQYDSNSSSGTSNSNFDPTQGIGSEWNNLIYRVHKDTPENQEGENWRLYGDDSIIVGTGAGKGRNTWCQEKPSYNTSYRIYRGPNTLSDFGATSSGNIFGNAGWRPVLELQQE